jgi:uncharacterized protein YecT (DUF1311 family)
MRPSAAIVLGAILCAAAATAAQAQNRAPTIAEIAAVRACAEQYKDDVGAAEADCVFKLVAEPCIDKEGGSNLGTADCYRVETVVWDQLLNENYKELLGSLDDKEQEQKLRAMQRAWIAYRDTTCDFFWHKIRGSMSVPMTASCRLRETARRALLLKFFTGL